MATLRITLRDEDQRFIDEALKAGRYVSESEAVSDAIAELRAREESRQARLGAMRAQVMVGIEQLDRGEGAPWNPRRDEGKSSVTGRTAKNRIVKWDR